MDNNKEVFTSGIVRANNKLNNNLYELLRIVPAKSLPHQIPKISTCNFIPRNDKYYVPKKKLNLKVKTVRNIREQFERDVYSDLHSELDKQRTVLFRKIRIGSAREESTKKIAKSILSNDFPVSKDVWDMVMNLNPDGYTFSSQYVLWNGKSIRINGSKGGKTKFISKHDLGKIKLNSNNSVTKRNVICHKKRLLQNSLHTKFRPGPLSKKKVLDVSYQKYQCGNATIISLPRPALDVQPLYGAILESQMSSFLNETFMHNSEGKITKQWADFSVSVLGKNSNGQPIQINKDDHITFNLKYKCDQNRLLMRNPRELTFNNNDSIDSKSHTTEEIDLTLDIKNIMTKIIDYVEFNVEYSNNKYEIDNLEISSSNNYNVNETPKERGKKKYGELDRLDVTIIKLPGTQYQTSRVCGRSYCALGCICDSLECPYTFKTHCGRVECMFDCRCAFSKSISAIPSLSRFIDLDSKMINSKLAKEEQKFRQTVVLSNEGSIVLNSQRRDWKASKKYGDFYSKMCLKTETKLKKNVSLVLLKLNCSHIEPWCMVHNLYKCFCKGKFTERALSEIQDIKSSEDIKNSDKEILEVPQSDSNETFKSKLRVRTKDQGEERHPTSNKPESNIQSKTIVSDDFEVCARVEPYKGRKFSDGYYNDTNRKIMEMEQNDRTLLKKLLSTIYNCDEQEVARKEMHTLEVGQPPTSLKELLNNVVQNDIETNIKQNLENSDKPLSASAKRLPGKTKLVAWLEASYKQYKERADQGIVTTSLDPPKVGKVALYPWEFVLSRYRDRKNLFLITKQKPYRILMAVNTKNPFFESCININDISLTELEKYPITVRNLLTNASDLKDNFCILCGLMHCWELIGSVTKVNEMKRCDEKSNAFNCDNMAFDSDNESLSNSTTLLDEDSRENCNTESLLKDFNNLQEKPPSPKIPNDSELSKWFVMTVENDFNEIHFYMKGFFVKYDSVIKAINVSRVSGKTVRLSSQKCNSPQTVPQFGIYAIPNESDLNVFIGPYDKHELLGIETVKTTLPRDNTRKTRGSWIMVNKVDNVKIIDQPLAFLPSSCSKNEVISLENEIQRPHDKVTAVQPVSDTQKFKCQEITKSIKPIKVRKIFKPISLHKSNSNSNEFGTTSVLERNENKKAPITNKPVAEIAPHVKDGGVTNNEAKESTSTERGMFVLKPEEINQRSLLKQTANNQEPSDSMEMDIENFLATSDVCEFPSTDILVISDDEDDEIEPIKNVWIQATNIENLGWIAAKHNASNDNISFEFPGFKFTDFYSKHEAFKKLNLVFSRKVYVPKHLNIQWEVVEDQSKLHCKDKLKSHDLRPELVMTKQGLKDRRQLMRIMKLKKKLSETDPNSEEFVKRRKLLMNLEDKRSSKQEDNTINLLNNKKVVILNNISEANEVLRKGMFERLNSMLSDSDSI